ncbi:MAG: ATP-binding protein [candidate division Zixibacteria bacterium]
MVLKEKVFVTHRLHFKIALFVILTIIIIIGLFSAYQIFSYRQMLTNMEIESSEELGRTLTSSLEIAMLNSDIESIQYSITEVAKNNNIESVFLLNMENVVKASSREEMIGQRMDKQDSGCKTCHGVDGNLLFSTVISMDNEELLRVVTPIKNKPSCYSCHGEAAKLNGILVMDHSLSAIKSEIVSNLKLVGSIAFISVLLMMFLFRWYIKRQVINRVVYLESLARRIVSNELDLDIELQGKDELSSLASSFNNMKDSLKLSIQKIDNHRNYLSHLFENLIDGILIIDDLSRVAFINKSLRDILEIDPDTLQTGDLVDFGEMPLNRFSAIGRFIAMASEREIQIKETVKMQISPESQKHIEIHIGNLLLPPWLKPETILVIRDVTARVTFENQVYQAEKLATIGRLAAGIAHEINNPMASILTCAEGLIKQETEADYGKREYLDIIKNSARRCKLITQKLLDYSAISKMNKETINLGEILEEAVSLLQFEATGKQVQLRIIKPENIPSISGSKDSLVQVFVNLILNGIQAVAPGGNVIIRVKIEKDTVNINFDDDGQGIKEENLSRVFDPFFTTKPVGVGTGLGLSVSQGIVKQHGGNIEIVQSKKGLTSILVSIPITSKKIGSENDNK